VRLISISLDFLSSTAPAQIGCSKRLQQQLRYIIDRLLCVYACESDYNFDFQMTLKFFAGRSKAFWKAAAVTFIDLKLEHSITVHVSTLGWWKDRCCNYISSYSLRYFGNTKELYTADRGNKHFR